MCSLIFPSKIWAKKCTLYTAKYGQCLLNKCPLHLPLREKDRIFQSYPHLSFVLHLTAARVPLP